MPMHFRVKQDTGDVNIATLKCPSIERLPKIQRKMPNLRVFHQKDANGKANSEDPNQTAPLEAV